MSLDGTIAGRGPDGSVVAIPASDSGINVLDGITQVPRTLEMRLLTFDAAADMPASIFTLANVSADRIKLDSFPVGTRAVMLIWHGFAGIASDGTNLVAPAALGALVTVNAYDDSEADGRLTQTNVTGAGTSSSGRVDTVMVSPSCPVTVVDVGVGVTLSRVDVIGVPQGITHGTAVYGPCYLEVRALA